MKKLLIGFIVLCIVFFIGGFVLTRFGYLGENFYITLASIAGGMASVVGLLSLVRPSISKSDIDALEVESLTKVTSLSKQIEMAKQEQAQTQEEIARLAVKKEEMQFLVRKASLSLFLQEQVVQKQSRIIEIVQQNRELDSLIKEYAQTIEKLSRLEEEIKADENVELLREIMAYAKTEKHETTDPIQIVAQALTGFAETFLGRVIR